MSDRITFRNARVKALILAATCGIILHCSVCESVFGQSLFLVHNGPLKLGSPKIPNKVIIFRVDDTAKTLETVYGPIPDTATWSQIWNIDVYSGDGPVVIAEGDWFPTKLYVLYPSAVTHAEIIDFKSYGTIMRYWYFRGNGKMDEIQIQYSINPLTKTAMPSMKRLLLETPTRQYKSEYPYDIQELRLTGGESEYGGGGKSDVVSLRMKADGVIEPKGIDINLNGNAVPDSIIRMKSSFGWTLIANEPTYRALLSVPERNGLTQRELLIYHRDSGIWNSIMLEGAETTLRVINGWLAGIIADCHPKTN